MAFQLRTYRRLPTQGWGTVLFAGPDGREGKGMLWNLSITGCRITTCEALATDVVLSILIALPNGRGLIIPRARVVWSGVGEYGLELEARGGGDLERLQAFIQAWLPPAISGHDLKAG